VAPADRPVKAASVPPDRGGADVLRKKKAGRLRDPLPAAELLDTVTYDADQMVQISADENKSENCHDCDDREDESILRETLSFLAVKVQEHGASFRKRRLAYVATIGRAFRNGFGSY
jgi:hypothetical protein